MADRCNISVPQLSLTVKDYEEAEERGWSDFSTIKVHCLQEERAGVIAQGTVPVTSISSSTQDHLESVPKQTKDVPVQKGRFSLYTVLILVLLTNLIQLGLHWL